MKETLHYLLGKNHLSREQAKDTLKKLAEGVHTEAEMAAFLTIYMMRAVTAEEMLGFREAMLELCVPIHFRDTHIIDVCGTGGDEKNTFNISTLAAFVLAGAGEKVVKHGNYGVSSPCGSSNIFEHLGYKFSNDQVKLQRELDEANICYMHAPLFHPAMKNIAPVRKALKLKTFFNMLGPMVNPCKPKYQVVGVYNEEVLDIYSKVYRLAGIEHIILYSLDGYDEISLTGDFVFANATNLVKMKPQDLGFGLVKEHELFGGETVDQSASIFINILEGKGTKAQSDAVIANAAFGIKCLHPELSLPDCVDRVAASLKELHALRAFKKIIKIQS